MLERIARCASTPSPSVPRRAPRDALAFVTISRAGSLSSIPASALTISPSGQNGSPLPYARQRPPTTFRPGCSVARLTGELPREAALADARRADQRDELRPPFAHAA